MNKTKQIEKRVNPKKLDLCVFTLHEYITYHAIICVADILQVP